ncbi:MAG: DUF6642 family protein [Bacteroidota bacterium]
MRRKGIFCLEGHWEKNLNKKSTVEPILSLLEKQEKIQYIHHKCATKEEINYLLSKWSQSLYKSYPILYFAFHGRPGEFEINSKENYSLVDLAQLLEGKCNNRVIFFAACKTLSIPKKEIMSFIRTTKALAVCGYNDEVDWMISTAFELLVLFTLQNNVFDGRGINAIRNKINSGFSLISDQLEFRMLTKND